MKAPVLFLSTSLGAFAQGPVAPPTTIYGTVRDLSGEIIDNPLFEQIAIFADGVEIGRTPLQLLPNSDENYRFDISNFSVVSSATFSARVIRDGQPVSVFDSDFSFYIFQPMQGALRRFDFVEKVDLDLDGIPDELESVDLAFLGDFDNDGLKDFQELALGTDPTDGMSGLNFKVVRQLLTGDVEIAFDVVTGRSYILQVSRDLIGWAEVSRLTAGGNSRLTVNATPISGMSNFWRIAVQ